MSPLEALNQVRAGLAILVDVREEEELVDSGMAEAAVWMPMSAMQEDSDSWRDFKKNLPKDKAVILYCRSGNRSGRIAHFLACDGYETINLGGFQDWIDAGLPVKSFKNK